MQAIAAGSNLLLCLASSGSEGSITTWSGTERRASAGESARHCADRGDHRLRHAGDGTDHPACPHRACAARVAGCYSLTITLYLIGLAIGQLLYGPVSDRLPAPSATIWFGTVHPGRHGDSRCPECDHAGDRADTAIHRRLRRLVLGRAIVRDSATAEPSGRATGAADAGDVGGAGNRSGARRLRHRVVRLARRVALLAIVGGVTLRWPCCCCRRPMRRRRAHGPRCCWDRYGFSVRVHSAATWWAARAPPRRSTRSWRHRRSSWWICCTSRPSGSGCITCC